MTRWTRALALAEAIVTGAGGEFRVSTGPLLIVADFPVKHESKSAAIDKSKAVRVHSRSVGI